MKNNFNMTSNSLAISLLILISPLTNIQAYQDNFITNNNEWCILSPTINNGVPVKKISTPFTMKTLQKMGEQADQLWQLKKSPQDAILEFDTIFNGIQKQDLASLIDEILNDDVLLDQVVQASYRNVTGFLKIVLVTGGSESWKIRLHVWEEKEQKEFPHNHKWDFYSKIISGYLTQEIYEKSSTCSLQKNYSVREPVSLMPASDDGQLPCPCRDNYILNPKESDAQSINLQVRSKDIIAAGESYIMPRHLIHTITPARGSISLVFTSEKITENSEVFVPLDAIDTDLSRYAPSVTKQELIEELHRVKAILNQLHIQPTYLPEVVDSQHSYYNVNRGDSILNKKEWRNELHKTNDRKKVVQLSDKAKNNYVMCADSQAKALINGEPCSANYDYLFVLFDKTMYAAPKDFHHIEQEIICHTSFSNYGPVDSVGVLHFNDDGDLIEIEAYSGHYAPSQKDMEHAKNHLNSIGVNTNKASLTTYKDRILAV